MTGRLAAVLGTWSAPPDLIAKIALGVAVVIVLLGLVKDPPLLRDGSPRRFLAVTGGIAALLSIAYISTYLRGGPRIIDASTYFLEGRALSHGDMAWTPLSPSASFRGRFLIYEDGHLGGIFPPGYPLLLVFGFWIGAPMIIGPLLAGAIVVATYRLAKTLSNDEAVARAAALLSVVCATLRYHTADTMSHGATALGIAIALDFALRKRAFVAWLAVGYVVATRPVSALPIGLVVAALTLRSEKPRALLGLLPGVGLLLLHQHAVTGAWLTSTQRMYYAISDGPPGCFRWGFGSGTGCVFEHGDFVNARIPDGTFGAGAAFLTTIRRLHHHLLDVANFEPLALLALVPAFKMRGNPVRLATALIGLQVLAYAPFYFDGDYPGAGARFFADLLPVEHVLVMLGVKALAKNVERWLHIVIGVACVGFAVHGAFEHVKLRDRDGGQPAFEPDVVTARDVKKALVFVDNDSGFNLAYDPGVTSAKEGIVYARIRDDDRDRMLFESLDRPESYKYVRADGIRGPVLVPWSPPLYDRTYRFEAEPEWPVLAQTGGFAVPGWSQGCASGKRALVLTPSDTQTRATADFELPVPSEGTYEVGVKVANTSIPFAKTTGAATPASQGTLSINEAATFIWAPPRTCSDLPTQTVKLSPPSARLRLTAEGGAFSVDAITLRNLGSR